MSDDMRDGLARALADAMGWNWSADDPMVPTPAEAMEDAADAALAYIAGQGEVVEASPAERHTEAVARVLSEHQRGYRTGLDGYEWAACSGCEWGRDVCISRQRPDLHDHHVAEQIAALLPTAPEVVTTAAELDALPVGSVVLDGMGTAWQHTHQSEWKSHSRGWSAWGSPDLAILRGPFRVLYRPTVDGAR